MQFANTGMVCIRAAVIYCPFLHHCLHCRCIGMAVCGINTLRNYSSGFVGHRLTGRQTTDGLFTLISFSYTHSVILLQMITYSFNLRGWQTLDFSQQTLWFLIEGKTDFMLNFTESHISLCSRTPELAHQNQLLLFNVINFITALPAVTPTCPLFGMFVHVFWRSDFRVGNFVTLPVLSVGRSQISSNSAANIKVESSGRSILNCPWLANCSA